MQVLALNSSARKGNQSKTELMLSYLTDGMRQAGALVDSINLRHGTIVTSPGAAKTPDLIIRNPFGTWVAIQCVAADGARLFLDGAYSAQGDIDLLIRLREWFGRSRNHP